MQFIDVADGKLCFSQTELPTIQANECLIKVKAIGVNRADILQRQGKYPAPKGESSILGLEVSGEITQVGSYATKWKLGQKVFGLVAGGAYAQYVAINSDHIMVMPERFSFEQGAATAETFLTAYQSLFTIGHLQPNERVLIHAGASGVGTAAIQLAKSLNCHVVSTVGSQIKVEKCLALGAESVVNYKEDDFVKWTKTNLPQGFNLVLDVVGGDYLPKNVKCSAIDGRIIMLALLGGRYTEQLDIAQLLVKRLQITASTLRNRSNNYKTALVNAFIHQFGDALNKGNISPVIDSVYSWRECELAHLKMIDNANIGKLVLLVD